MMRKILGSDPGDLAPWTSQEDQCGEPARRTSPKDQCGDRHREPMRGVLRPRKRGQNSKRPARVAGQTPAMRPKEPET
jgi:hypothetical protein